MNVDEVLDYAVVRRLQAEVADLMTVTKQARDLAGERPLTDADERQMALSVIQRAVSRYMQAQIGQGTELPDSSVDLRLVIAVDAAIYGAGELQELLGES